MATLKLTIYHRSGNTAIADLSQDIVLDTLTQTASYKFGTTSYTFSLLGINVTMQMYRPSEILADIGIKQASGTGWTKITREDLKVFKDKKVGLSSDSFEIGNDFYVHEVIPEYYSDHICLKLRIFSPDKLLTLRKTSRTFVGKRLSEILDSELVKYHHPADTASKDTTVKYDTGNLRVLMFDVTVDQKKKTYEHMFPFLVQYNESFYDLLARTANRWGEFMYYRDGKLCFGYNANQIAVKKEKYLKITYPSYNTDSTLTNDDTSGIYDLQAVYDKTVSNTPVEKSPYIVKGELGKFGGIEDKYLMRKAASFLANDKDLITWLFNNLVDDSVSVAEAVAYKKQLNDDQDENYFTGKFTTDNPQYGKQNVTLYDDVKERKEVYNEFTELNSPYNGSKYQAILEAEKTAGENIVQIDFDSTSPDVRLGDLITIDGEQLIVVGITVRPVKEPVIKENGDIEDVIQIKFTVTALGRKDGKGLHYPTMLPSGHVRYSGPQKGIIWDEDDPTLKHRVRVLFDWQIKEEENEKTKKLKKKEKDADTKPSPWLVFAAKGDGNPSTGRHVNGTEVLVGFVGGNIERPYVMGAIQNKAGYDTTIDVDIDTDQGHYLRMSDGSRGAGLSSFLFGALSPAASTIADFIPDFAFNAGKSAHLEGGFTIGDYYGIYKISGSSDQRNITISSPWGDVKMNAFTGITISAPNGDVKISGKNVTIEAGNNLNLVSGKNVGYKLYQDKKYKDTSAATVLMSASAAIVNRLAQKFTLLDLSIVRSVVEIVMRPIEGALTVKSSRFLKLEAGKNACEYPISAFDKEKKQKIIDAAAGKELKGDKALSQGLVNLFGLIPQIVDKIQEKFNTFYKECRTAKTGYENAIVALKFCSEDQEKAPCKNYEDLKSVLWKENAKDLTIKEDDLGFVDTIVGIKKDSPTKNSESKYGTKDNVIKERENKRTTVLKKANALRMSITNLLELDINKKSAEKLAVNIFGTVPKDAGTKLFNAMCKDKNKDLFIYTLSKEIKSLAEMTPIGDLEVKFLKRVFTLKLVQEYKLTGSKRAKVPTVTNVNGTGQNNIMNDNAWFDFVFNLRLDSMDDIAGKKTDFNKWKEDMTGVIDTVMGDLDVMSLISRTKSALDERHSWNHDNNGCILFGANDQTYIVGEGDTAQLSKIEKLTPKIPGNVSEEFLWELRRKLWKL